MELHDGTSFIAMESSDLGLASVPDLVGHLRSQNAHRTAQRLLESHGANGPAIASCITASAAEPAEDVQKRSCPAPQSASAELFRVALEAVRVVSDEAYVASER